MEIQSLLGKKRGLSHSRFRKRIRILQHHSDRSRKEERATYYPGTFEEEVRFPLRTGPDVFYFSRLFKRFYLLDSKHGNSLCFTKIQRRLVSVLFKILVYF